MTPLLSQMRAKAASKLNKTCIIVSICCFVFFLLGIGSGLYSASMLNNPTPVPDAVKHFQHLYKVEGALEDDIKSNVVPKVKNIADDTVQIVNDMVSRLVRQGRSVGSRSATVEHQEKFSRLKREAANKLDPNQHMERESPISADENLVRSKRNSLEKLREELRQCKQYSGNNCGIIYDKIHALTQEIDQRFLRMKSIVEKMRPSVDEVTFDQDKEKIKLEKKRLKQELKQKLLEQGLRDCSSEEMLNLDGSPRDVPGCAVNMKDHFKNDTSILHNKTKIYSKPIALSTTTEVSTTAAAEVGPSFVRTSTDLVTPALPDDTPDVQPLEIVPAIIPKPDTTSTTTTTEQPKIMETLDTFEQFARHDSDRVQVGFFFFFQGKPISNAGQHTLQTDQSSKSGSRARFQSMQKFFTFYVFLLLVIVFPVNY